MIRGVLTAALLAGTVLGSAPAQAWGTVSVSVGFETSLSPYGDWVMTTSYGRVWRPHRAVVDVDFVPYQSGGHWVNTEYGWMFVSDYEWGWAAFHYGRWYMDPWYGWVWVPDTVWGPSWVEWRYGGGYVGWAPLGPPGVVVNVWSPHWCYVETRYFAEPDFYRYRVPDSRVSYVHEATAVVPPQQMGQSRYYMGPPASQVSRDTGRTVMPAPVQRPPPGQIGVTQVSTRDPGDRHEANEWKQFPSNGNARKDDAVNQFPQRSERVQQFGADDREPFKGRPPAQQFGREEQNGFGNAQQFGQDNRAPQRPQFGGQSPFAQQREQAQNPFGQQERARQEQNPFNQQRAAPQQNPFNQQQRAPPQQFQQRAPQQNPFNQQRAAPQQFQQRAPQQNPFNQQRAAPQQFQQRAPQQNPFNQQRAAPQQFQQRAPQQNPFAQPRSQPQQFRQESPFTQQRSAPQQQYAPQRSQPMPQMQMGGGRAVGGFSPPPGSRRH